MAIDGGHIADDFSFSSFWDPILPVAATLHAGGGCSRAALSIFSTIKTAAENVQLGVAGTQFTTVLLMPFSLGQLASKVYNMFTEMALEEKLDNFLGFLGDISENADGVANIAEACVGVGVASAETMIWAGPLGLAAALASSVFLVTHGLALKYNEDTLAAVKSIKIMNPQTGLKKYDFQKLRDMISEPSTAYHLEQYIQINAEEVCDKLNSVEADPALMKEIYKGLKDRIKKDQFSHSLGVVITLIGIAASVILFVTGLAPWVIAGCALLCGLYILSFSKMVLDIDASRKFEQLVKIPTVMVA
jgi:hypothetical protein